MAIFRRLHMQSGFGHNEVQAYKALLDTIPQSTRYDITLIGHNMCKAANLSYSLFSIKNYVDKLMKR